MSEPAGLSLAQIRLHWIVALLLIPQFLAHDGIKEAWRSVMKTGDFEPSLGVVLHIGTGIVILLLVLWRLVLRVRRGGVVPPEDQPRALHLVAVATRRALYLVLVLLPVSGMAAWALGAELPAEVHEVMTNVLLGLVALHLAGAFVQHFVLRGDALRRMLRLRA